MKEMETIMTVVDLLASNDILRGLDVLIQRQKAIELAADQGSWAQAQYLELTHADEEHSYFRQELKAVQAERKADLGRSEARSEVASRGAHPIGERDHGRCKC